METTKPINFSLKNITTEQYAQLGDTYDEKKPVALETQMRFAADLDKKLIAVFCPIKFMQDEKPFLVLEIACHFAVPEESWNEFKAAEEGAITVPKGFITHLAMLTVGTARGVLYCKTENTSFSKFLLPPINVGEMVKGDVIFKQK